MRNTRSLIAISALLLLSACGGGDDGIDGAIWVNKGRVVDEAGAGISDANVSVVLDKTYSATTDSNGNYTLNLPQDYAYPPHFSGLATKSGVVPKPVLFDYENGRMSFSEKTTTRLVKDSDILFPSSMKVIHLGDSKYAGASNAQFQFPNATGTHWFETATLSAEQKSKYSELCISFYAKGVDDNSPKEQSILSVSLNGQAGTYNNYEVPPTARDGSYTIVNHCFSLQGFNAQDAIQAQLNSLPDSKNDFDDFEFIAVTGVLK